MAATPRVPDSIGNLKFLFASNRDDGITAFAGGGQTNATQITAQATRISVTATTSDSCKLPKIVQSPGRIDGQGASLGAILIVGNFGAATAQIYGTTADTVNGIATGTGVTLPAGTCAIFVAMSLNSSNVGNWMQTTPNSVASGSGTFSALTGSAATFPIAGLAAAQGGSLTVAAGASSTSANAGGLATVIGGAPGATGVGGGATVAGAAGGATSGAGGALTLVGGAGTAGNAAGGAASFTSGAGQGSANSGVVTVASGVAGATGASGAITITSGTSAGGATGAVTLTSGAATGGVPGTVTVSSGNANTAATAGGAIAITAGTGNTSGAGGAITVTSGAAGSTGVAGAIAIAVGAATAGNGSSITVTGGNGAGGTASGGNVNLVPGTAVSTGIPGEIQVNANSQLIAVKLDSIGVLEVVTRVVYTCTRPMRFKAFSASQATSSTSGTVTVEKLTGTTAPGGGTALLSAPVSMSGVINTVLQGTLIATVASLTFATGDRVGFVFAGTMTNLVGFNATALFAPT